MTRPSRRPVRAPAPRRGWSALGLIFAALASGMLALFLVPALQSHTVTAVAAAFVPHAIVLWGLAGLILLLAGRGWGRALALVALAGGLLHAQVLLPYTGRFPAPPGDRYTVATLNLHFGQADLDALAKSPAMDASVLVLTEAGPALNALEAEPWVSAFPHRAGFPDGFHGGTVLLSRTPLSQVERTRSRETGDNAAFAVDTPLGSIVVIGAHPTNPMTDTDAWQRDTTTVLGLAEAVDPASPRVVLGDFNATLESAPLRELLAQGYSDAAAEAGSGWQPTFPANSECPPAIAIDHVLTSRELVATRTQTFTVPGTDHLGLIATLGRA